MGESRVVPKSAAATDLRRGGRRRILVAMPDRADGDSDARHLSEELLLRQCRWEAFRGPGPGGQKRNKTSSAVRVTHEPTGISATAGESRSQAQNRRRALDRLRRRMVLELRRPVEVDRFGRPDWFVAVLTGGTRLDLSPRSAEFLPAAGLVLDVLAAVGWRVSDGARVLGLTTGNLVEFLQADEKLWAHVNRARGAVGLKPLR
jgi:hypothetical protein